MFDHRLAAILLAAFFLAKSAQAQTVDVDISERVLIDSINEEITSGEYVFLQVLFSPNTGEASKIREIRA